MLDETFGWSAGQDNGDLSTWDASGSGTPLFNRSYTYGPLNRLATMSSPADPYGCYGLSWTYDVWGNRNVQSATSGSCPTFDNVANPNNQLTAPYGYDAAGNLIADPTHTYFYDTENRLIQVDGTLGTCSSATASYVYNAEGERAQKTVSGVSTDYHYDGLGRVVAEYDGGCGSTCWGTGYVYVNGALEAEYRNSTTYFVSTDHLSSTRIITGVDGSVADSLDFLPYGEQIAGDTFTTHKFTGKERDSETGNDNFLTRYYSSNVGRFVSPDPSGGHFMNPQSLNRYAYVHDNPLSMIDPTGMDCLYTQSLDRGDTVGYEQGDCSYADGTYVNGTIDTSSLQILQGDNGQYSLNFGFTSYDTGDYTLGGFALPGFSPASLASDGFGFGSWNYAAAVFSQTYQNTRAVTNPVNIAGFYGASAAVGATGLATATQGSQLAESILEYGPQAISKLTQLGYQASQGMAAGYDIFSEAVVTTAQNPDILMNTLDFLQGYTPGAIPATLAGYSGGLASILWQNRVQILGDIKQVVPH